MAAFFSAHVKIYAPYITMIKNFFVYSIGSLFLKIVSLIMIPLNMKKLSPADFGALSLVTSFIIIAPTIMGMGLRQVLSIEYFHTLESKKRGLISSIIILYLMIGLPFFVLTLLYKNFITRHIFLNTINSSLFLVVMLIVFLSFFTELFYQLLQYQLRAFILTSLQIFVALIITACTTLFLWRYNMGIAGVIFAQFIGTIIASLVAFATYIQKKYYDSPHELAQKAIAYLSLGATFIPLILCNWALSNVDRWMLAKYSSLYNVGIYATADLGAQLFYALILQPWGGSYLPYIMNRYHEHKENIGVIVQENLRIMAITMTATAGIISAAYLLGKPYLIYILPPSYHEALYYVWPILMGQIFLMGTYFTSSLIQFYKQTHLLLISLLIAATIKVILNMVMIPHWHIAACTITGLISYASYFVVTLLYARSITTNKIISEFNTRGYTK